MCTLFHVVTRMFSYALRNEQTDHTMSLEKVKNNVKKKNYKTFSPKKLSRLQRSLLEIPRMK